MNSIGPIGRLGRYTATHFRVVAIAWALLAVALGVLAPKVEHALSGAGWEATGSESVQARELVDRNFQGLSSSALQVVVHSPTKTVADPAFQQTISSAQRTLEADSRVASVIAPRPGQSISRDGHTAVIQAGAAADPNEMVRAADRAQGRRRRAGLADGRVGDVVGLQRGQPRGDAQERGHLLAGGCWTSRSGR